MKKSIILKSFLVILVSAMLVFMTSSVYAATSPEDGEFPDILEENTSSNSANTNTNSNSNSNTNSNSANTNSNVQNLNALRNNTSNRVNNTSNTLPKTGIQDSLPTVLLVVVFAISAIYAYKKIKDYRNID